MAFGAVYDHSKKYIDIEDSAGRSALMACARAGSTSNALKLIDMKCKM
jgi:hypothetical protein